MIAKLQISMDYIYVIIIIEVTPHYCHITYL